MAISEGQIADLKIVCAGRVRDLDKTDSSTVERRVAILQRIVPLLDLTNLSSSATRADIKGLCKMADTYGTAVCVNPAQVLTARDSLGTPFDHSGRGEVMEGRLVSVAGGFPLSQTPIAIKESEIRFARQLGARQVDVVLNQGLFLAGERDSVRAEVAAMRNAVGPVPMKVILEICELKGRVREASLLVAEGLLPGDYLKTSTGFGKHGATFEDVAVMLDVIAEVHKAEGKQLGMKPAGGIKTVGDALTYYFLAEEMLGSDYLNPKCFRFGASSLLPALAGAIEDALGYDPYTATRTAGFMGHPAYIADQLFEGVVPHTLPMPERAMWMLRELREYVGKIGNVDAETKANELLRIARFYAAETGLDSDSALCIVNALAGINLDPSLTAEQLAVGNIANAYAKAYMTPAGRREAGAVA